MEESAKYGKTKKKKNSKISDVCYVQYEGTAVYI